MHNDNIYPWHEDLWRTIAKYQKANRFPQALMLWGINGIGKNDFALRLAKILLCEVNQASPCQTCQSCQMFAKESHPDFIHIYKDSAKSSIPVDDIRALNSKLVHQSFSGSYVVLISLCEHLNTNAFNALLKILEEPPVETYFLLLSEELALIPKTILSRCQRLYFKDASKEDIKAYLTEQNLALDNMALLSGAPLNAQHLLDEQNISIRQQFNESMLDLTLDKRSPIDVAKIWQSIELTLFLPLMLNWCTDAVKYKLTESQKDIVNQDISTKLAEYVQAKHIIELLTILDKVIDIKRALTSRLNINHSLWLECLAIDIAHRGGRIV